MRAAVLAFQAENALPTDGEIGLDDRAALNRDAAKPMPVGERATDTASDLIAAGSQTMAGSGAGYMTFSSSRVICPVCDVVLLRLRCFLD